MRGIPHFDESTPKRVKQAIDERITKKHVQFDMTDEDRKSLSVATEHLCDELRESDAVDSGSYLEI